MKKPPPPRRRRDDVSKDDADRIAAYIPKELAQELRLRCVTDRRALSDAVTEAVRMWLKVQP